MCRYCWEEEKKQQKSVKYRKKPVEIEAVKFTGRNSADIHEFCGSNVKEPVFGDCMLIDTLEGVMKVSTGDYIIKGVKGEFYPCKPDIFEMTYEKVWVNPMDKVAEILQTRSFIFMLSYQTTWRDYMTDEEKGNFTFIDIMQYIDEVEERKRFIRKVMFLVTCF